jgi:hypothetical protein
VSDQVHPEATPRLRALLGSTLRHKAAMVKTDQSQFCHHFKRLVGVTPGQFGMPARIA